jgi:hypothetical protein
MTLECLIEEKSQFPEILSLFYQALYFKLTDYGFMSGCEANVKVNNCLKISPDTKL